MHLLATAITPVVSFIITLVIDFVNKNMFSLKMLANALHFYFETEHCCWPVPKRMADPLPLVGKNHPMLFQFKTLYEKCHNK